jgi:hypothetical protein
VQRLQVQLVGRLGCDELHSWALHRSAIASAQSRTSTLHQFPCGCEDKYNYRDRHRAK